MKDKLKVVFEEYWPVIREKTGSFATDISDEDLKIAVLKANSLVPWPVRTALRRKWLVKLCVENKQRLIDNSTN